MIDIVPNYFDVHPSDIKIFVDGASLDFLEGKYALYKSPPILKNVKIIKISCQIRNQVTNRWEATFTDIPYEIRLN